MLVRYIPEKIMNPDAPEQPGQSGSLNNRTVKARLVLAKPPVFHISVTAIRPKLSFEFTAAQLIVIRSHRPAHGEIPFKETSMVMSHEPAEQPAITQLASDRSRDEASVVINLDDDRLHEECGVFGIWGHPDAAALTALGLHALQHRGQEACGIVTFDGEQFHPERRMGLVGDHFNSQKVIDRLRGNSAIGHVRYSTSGGTHLRNVQPLFADLASGGFALAHNGNVTNAYGLRRELIRDGAIFQSTSDTEVILHLMARAQGRRVIERFIEALRQIEGAYGLVNLASGMLIGARDPIGIRPLLIGRLDNAYILTSETCALDMVGAKFVREVDNGEIVVINDQGIQSHRPFPQRPARPCIFEFIYFARPDSVIGGRNVYEVRKIDGSTVGP